MKIKNKPIIEQVENANDTVGIEFDGNHLHVKVPLVFRYYDDLKLDRHDLLLFLKSISLAKDITHEQLEKSRNRGFKWPIDSYLWIIKDYLENGYYYNREKIYSNDKSGKINWKKTLKSLPIVSGGNVIYDKITIEKMSASNDIISQIYKLCLKLSYSRIGWLFESDFFIDVQQIKSVKEMIFIITKEKQSTYDDIKNIRYGHMLNILHSVEHGNMLSKQFTYTIDNYYYVFEKMVDTLFGGLTGEEKKKYNPKGYWKLRGEKEKVASMLRPDTVYKRNNEVLILDAKMYKYGYTHEINDLPDTTSMQKQITYGDYVKNYIDIEAKVRNAFVLPYNKELEIFKNDVNLVKYKDDNIAYIGEAFVDWRSDSSSLDHERLFTYLIDFNFLLNNYWKKDSSYIKAICDSIDEMLNK